MSTDVLHGLVSYQILIQLTVAMLVLLLLFGYRGVPLNYNVRNLLVRWKTSAVTALAFTMVVALLIVMQAFVNGMQRLTESSGHPSNIMILSDGATDEVFSNLPPSVSIELLPSEARAMIEAFDKERKMVSQEVFVLVNQPLVNATPSGLQRRFIQMRGVLDSQVSAAVHDLELLQGKWLDPRGVREMYFDRNGKKEKEIVCEAVLGEGLARVLGEDLGQGPLEPGALVPIGPRLWYVTGVMRSGSTTFGSELWATADVIQRTFGKENSFSVFVVRTLDPAAAREATDLIKKERVGGTAVQVYTEREYYANLTATNKQFEVAILFVAVVMAIGGVLGVMNTMFAAISQRRKDIGVLRLLGFTRGQVLVSFLLESLVLALIGGAVGCALGYLADGWTATSIASSGQGGGKSVVLRLIVDVNILATGMLFTYYMGLVGGLVPSLAAMRLRPLESLR